MLIFYKLTFDWYSFLAAYIPTYSYPNKQPKEEFITK